MNKTSLRLRLIAGAVTLVFAVVAAIVVFVVQRGSPSEATTGEIAQRIIAKESALASSITAGTTLHEVVIVHDTPAQAALNKAGKDQRAEGWWAFGTDGHLIAYYAEDHDIATGALTGVHQLMPDGSLRITSYPDGKTQTFAQYNQLTATAVGAGVQKQADTARAALSAPGAAERALVVGGEYEIDTPGQRDFVDATTYRLVRTEAVNEDGATGQVQEYPTFEVQSGNTVPTTTAVPTPTSTALSTPIDTAVPSPASTVPGAPATP